MSKNIKKLGLINDNISQKVKSQYEENPYPRWIYAKIYKENTKRDKPVETKVSGTDFKISDGDVVIAAITSCTNTSNPSVLIGAGLLAKKAQEKKISKRRKKNCK